MRKRYWFLVLVLTLAIGLMPNAALAEPRIYRGKTIVGVKPYSGQPKTIAINIDDGAGKNTLELAKIFAANETSATFFLVGERTTRAQVDELRALGMEIANHNVQHVYNSRYGTGGLTWQIAGNSQHLANLQDGLAPMAYRAPFNNRSKRSIRITNDAGMNDFGQWAMTRDYTGNSASKIARKILEAPPGAIILIHVGYPNTETALRQALPILKARGTRVVTNQELLETGKPVKSIKSATRRIKVNNRWVRQRYWRYTQ